MIVIPFFNQNQTEIKSYLYYWFVSAKQLSFICIHKLSVYLYQHTVCLSVSAHCLFICISTLSVYLFMNTVFLAV